jgi:hypothetical protein
VEVGGGTGDAGVVVGDLSSVKVVLDLPDVALRRSRWAEVSNDRRASGRTFTAHVSRIASAADPTTRNFDVEVEIPNGDRLAARHDRVQAIRASRTNATPSFRSPRSSVRRGGSASR